MLNRRTALSSSLWRVVCILSVLPIAFARPHIAGDAAGAPRPLALATAPSAPTRTPDRPVPSPTRAPSRATARPRLMPRPSAPFKSTPSAAVATATSSLPTATPLDVRRVSITIPHPAQTQPAATAHPAPPKHRAASIPTPRPVYRAPRLVRPAPAPRIASLSLHAVGSQLYTTTNTPFTLKAINWYGFEYAPFVPDGLDRAPLDTILFNVRRLGFNALRLTFADQTVRWNPVITSGVAANPQLKGLRALDVMERVIQHAGRYGLRVVLCNSRSEAGMGPEQLSGLWYTSAYPDSVWQADWEILARRFRGDTAFVGADLRNEPHEVGSGSVDEQTYLNDGPIWGPYRGRYYPARDWRLAAQHMGNALLGINPRMLIIVEGVQIYFDARLGKLSGGLWGSNLMGVRTYPVRLARPGQLVYSVHEYGPQMWQGDWFNPNTSYASLARRWTRLWGYLLNATSALRAPIFVGEFGTCHNYSSCITDTSTWKQGFWFDSFVRYLHANPEIGWAYWSLNPTGPFHRADPNFYSLMSPDWRHYYPLVVQGLAPILAPATRSAANRNETTGFAPVAGCAPNRSCLAGADRTVAHAVTVLRDVPYIQPSDPARSGDLYLPQTGGVGRPAVVVVHGGSWDNGRKGSPGTAGLALALARHGYVTFDINYRLSGAGGEYPRNIRDVEDAVAYLAASSTRLRVDRNKLAVTGISSGGYLALMAAYRDGIAPFVAPHYPGVVAHIQAVGAFFAPVELKATVQSAGGSPRVDKLAAYMGASFDQNHQRYRMASPLRYANSAVPTIFWYGDSDPLTPVAQTFELYKRLKQREMRSALINLHGKPRHLTDLSSALQATVIGQLESFFDDTLSFRPG